MSLIRVTFGINILVFFSIFLIKIIARLYENYECSLTSNCLQKITFNSFINDLIFRIPSPDKRGKEEVKHAQKSYNQTLQASGDGLVIDDKGTVGIATNNIETNTALVGAANSMTGLYIGDGSLLFNNTLNRDGGYYITTSVNALNAGPVSLGTTMTLDGTWVIV